MRLNLIGPFVVNAPFGTEIAFSKGLRRIGHEVVEVDPNIVGSMPDPLADVTVVFKSCVGREDEMLTGLEHPIVVYQPDDARFPHIMQMIDRMSEYSDLFLSFDAYGAEVAMERGYRAAQTLLLTADDELYCPSPSPIERDIDVSFIGSLGDPVAHASRRRMCEIVAAEAERRGWKTAFGSCQHIPTVLDIYRRSKVVLNHATDVGQGFGQGYGLQCRHFEVAMTKTCLLSNSRPLSAMMMMDSFAFLPTFSSEETLIERLKELLTDQFNLSEGSIPRYEAWGDVLYHSVMKFDSPQRRAEQLVSFIERNA